MLEILDEQAHPNTSGIFGVIALGFAEVGGTGDVEMGPGDIIDKGLDEHSRGDGGGRAARGIFHIGDIGFEEIAIFLMERQAPEALKGFASGPDEGVGEGIIIRKKA